MTSPIQETLRALGISLFVIPRTGPPEGNAYYTSDLRPQITLWGNLRSPEGEFVLWHEMAHLVYHDVHPLMTTTLPLWTIEHRADQYALRKMSRRTDAETLARLEQMSRDHIRPLIQQMIDDNIDHHVDRQIAQWAGCQLKSPLREIFSIEGGLP